MNLIVVISYNCLFLIKIYAIMMIDSRSTAKNKSSFVSRFGKPFSFISDCKAIHQIWLQGRVIYLCSMTKALFLPTFLVCKYAKLQGVIYSTYLSRVSRYYVVFYIFTTQNASSWKTFETFHFKKLILVGQINYIIFLRKFKLPNSWNILYTFIFIGKFFVLFRWQNTFGNSTNFAYYTLSLFLKCHFFSEEILCRYYVQTI